MTTHGFASWWGGLTFLYMIVRALLATRQPMQLFVIIPETHDCAARGYDDREIVDLFSGLEGVTVVLIPDSFGALCELVQKNDIDVILPSLQILDPSIGVPWIGYMYDFQHRYMPNFFSSEEIAGRDQFFALMGNQPKAVIVNSRAVAADADRFVPGHRARIFALPFSPMLPPEHAIEPDSGEVAATEFLICNQMWKHKDHGTAIEALAQVVTKFPQARVVCTGHLSEFRDASYVDGVKGKIAALGLERNIELLGFVPKREQVSRLRRARALIQPTLFEGGPGGGAVYDAIALGVPVLVSDIPVNREIDCGEVRFFRAGDAADLARLMEEAILTHPGARPSYIELRAAEEARLARWGETLLQALRFVS